MFIYIVLTPISTTSGLRSTGNKYHQIDVYIYQCEYETLSKECLDLLQKFSIDGLELCRLGNINPVPECLCKLVFFAGQVCPVSRDNTASDGEPLRKKTKKAETPTVSSNFIIRRMNVLTFVEYTNRWYC